MDRRSFLTRTGVFLGLLQYSRIASAAEPKADKAAKKGKKKAEKVPQEPPLPWVPGSWTLAVLPDTQHYADRFPGMLRLQTQWIADHAQERNIAYVIQCGDVTHRNSPREWKRVDQAFKVLDSKVPYAVVTGNHDHGWKDKHRNRTTRINTCFPPSRFESWPTFGGTMEPGHIESNYHLFEVGGKKWLIVGLEWAPRDKTLEWADTILKKYPDRKAIVFTHAYLYHDSTRYDRAAKGNSQKWNPSLDRLSGTFNDGEQIWQKLIKKHPNVFLVVNGHVLGDGLGFQVSTAEHGNRVNEMLVNYQMLELGGASWLRLLEFLPDGKTVQAKSYCPLYEKYKTDPQNQFTFTVE